MVSWGPEAAIEWLKTHASVGDLILIGSGDPVARIIQRGTGSPYSHAAIVTEPGKVTEAYDNALTLAEHDDGLFLTCFEKLLSRPKKLRRILLLRPPMVDEEKLKCAAKHMLFHSPSYPTFGASMLSICRMFSEPILMPSERKGRQSGPIYWTHVQLDRLARAQVHFVGDGVRRVHCCESVFRLYQKAEIPVRLESPVLRRSMQRAAERNNVKPETILPPNIATAGRWRGSGRWKPVRLLLNTYQIVDEVLVEVGTRVKDLDTAEPADYIFPTDLENIEGFTKVDEFAIEPTPGRARAMTIKVRSWSRASTARRSAKTHRRRTRKRR